MPRRIIIVPYKMGSASARALQEKLIENIPDEVLRVSPTSQRFRPRNNDIFIHWGLSNRTWDIPLSNHVLNELGCIRTASNKLSTLIALQMSERVNTIPFTTNAVVARQWLGNGHTVIGRQTLSGHSGEGIQIMRNIDEFLPSLPLYTLYKKKRNEFRVHVYNGQIILIQEKRRVREFDRTADQSLIRSHANGWVFCTENINVQPSIGTLAVDTIDVLGLDFGAVDIIYNQREDTFYVLEVNTAPGLEGNTVDIYANNIINTVNHRIL